MHIIPGRPPDITLESDASLTGMLPPPVIDTEEARASGNGGSPGSAPDQAHHLAVDVSHHALQSHVTAP